MPQNFCRKVRITGITNGEERCEDRLSNVLHINVMLGRNSWEQGHLSHVSSAVLYRWLAHP